jgi:ParB family transcriptional regulator, chromosome partitioning protein
MSRKSFKEQIKDDFSAKDFPKESRPKRIKTKPLQGARLIPLSEIHPDPGQPRTKISRNSLDELALSIAAQGVIEPITAFKAEDGYQIITGERRFKAAKQAGLEEIPCIIKNLSNDEIIICQIIENLQRENLNPVEEARALKKLKDQGHSQAKIGDMVGKSQPYISQSLKILSLTSDILQIALKENWPKEKLLEMVNRKKRKKLGRPKVKPWTWRPKDKEFSVSIKFSRQNYDKYQIIKALELVLQELKMKV